MGGKKRSKSGNPKYVGSCGIYVFADPDGMGIRMLVQRRSKQVYEPNTIASPGGIVERCLCGPGGADFEIGARTAAARELLEETGVALSEDDIGLMAELPVGGTPYWGVHRHRNYCWMFSSWPAVTGPERASLHELVRGGLEGIGEPAGDGYHAWVDISELLDRPDLMPGCRVPLEYIAENGLPQPGSQIEAALGGSAPSAALGVRGVRGSVAAVAGW